MSGKIHYTLSNHARTVMAERDILETWVGRVLTDPKRIEPDASDPALRHALGRIPGQGDRVLRVVYNETVRPWRVVTAYFDRGMRGKL